MNHYVHDLNPFLFELGFIRVPWYGLMYLISFVIGYLFLKKNYAKKNIKITQEQCLDFIFYIMLGVMIGGRLGYVIFYGLLEYLKHPLDIFKVWEGGMSFHGGAIGTIIAGLIYCKKNKFDFYTLADPAMPFVAIGLGLGRIGNFINGELYGKVSDVPWAVIFPEGGPWPRHPSQLYEALFEGFLMAIFLQLVLLKTSVKGLVFWLFIGSYGIVRFLIEYIRIPDTGLDIYKHGMIFGVFSMGQVLSLCMIVAAVIGFIAIRRVSL